LDEANVIEFEFPPFVVQANISSAGYFSGSSIEVSRVRGWKPFTPVLSKVTELPALPPVFVKLVPPCSSYPKVGR
jgi:hypothetical protein